MSVKRELFGKLDDGRESYIYILENKNRMSVKICDIAAAIVSISVPDRNGDFADVVLGYDEARYYRSKGAYLGAVIGRVANRIENAEFSLNGNKYKVSPNHQKIHNIHGGEIGIDSKLFEVEINQLDNSVTLKCTIPDGEDGFPGNVDVSITYKLTDENELVLNYLCTSDADTPLNLTNHSYFNLCGHSSGKDILNHNLMILSKEFTPLKANGMVDGTVKPVNKELDFSAFKRIGQDIDSDCEQLRITRGYDHNYVLPVSEDKKLILAAVAEEETTGRFMKVYTNSPGILLYTGNYLEENNKPGKQGYYYPCRSGFCLETGFYPNALKYPQYPQPILRKDEVFDYTTVFRFGVK